MSSSIPHHSEGFRSSTSTSMESNTAESALPSNAVTKALQMPEIVASILSKINDWWAPSPQELAVCARVCRAWTRPARVVLYSSLELDWRYTHIYPLLLSFKQNPSLLSLVRSVSINYWNLEDLEDEVGQECEEMELKVFSEEVIKAVRQSISWTEDKDAPMDELKSMTFFLKYKAHKDGRWFGKRREEADTALLNLLLRRIPNLKQLQLDFHGLEGEIPITSTPLWNALTPIIFNLRTLRLCHSNSTTSQEILSRASQLSELSLTGVSLSLNVPSLPHLQHLELDGTNGFPPESGLKVGINIADYHGSLETLELCLRGNDLPLSDFFGPMVSFPRLSHLHFETMEAHEKDLFTLIDNSSNLHYFTAVSLDPFLPHLPTSINTITTVTAHPEEVENIEKFTNELIRNTRRLTGLKQIDLQFGDELPSDGVRAELESKAGERGVTLVMERGHGRPVWKMRDHWDAWTRGRTV